MKLYQYDDIKKLNQALGSFAQNGISIAKVKLLTIGDKVLYFILADPPKETYRKPVESKIEEKAQKTIKEKKEVKVGTTDQKEEVKPK